MRNKAIILFIIASVLCLGSYAWVVESSPFLNVKRDIAYCSAEGVQLKMDIYPPESANSKPVPAIIYVHGGGWMKGDKAGLAGYPFFREFTKRGYLVAAVNYRLAPEHTFPAMIEDVKCAVRYLRANSGLYNINPDRIGAIGGSAGGHLVSLLGLTTPKDGFEGKGGYAERSSSVQAVVDLYGPSDFTGQDFSLTKTYIAVQVFGAMSRKDPKLKKASPVTYVTKDAPPFLIIQGDKDDLVPLHQSQLLYDKLHAAGVKDARLVIVKNAGHGFDPVGGEIKPSMREIVKMTADFFDKYLKEDIRH